jgi:plasmid stability protein
MGQILIRNIPEETMQAFKERAARRGRSQEQEARMLIESAVQEDRSWQEFIVFTRRMRQQLTRRGVSGDAARDVRADRDR